MRPILILFFLAASTSARAQYGYAPPTPSYPPNGGPSASPVQGQSPSSMPQAMLEAHNVIRARVGVPPLVWSDQLAEVAQDWANHLIAMGGLSHRPNNRYGENIYTISGGTAKPTRWSISGPRKRRETIFAAIRARASAAITRRLCGARHAL